MLFCAYPTSQQPVLRLSIPASLLVKFVLEPYGTDQSTTLFLLSLNLKQLPSDNLLLHVLSLWMLDISLRDTC